MKAIEEKYLPPGLSVIVNVKFYCGIDTPVTKSTIPIYINNTQIDYKVSV